MKMICVLLGIGMSALFFSCGYHLEGGGYLNGTVTRVSVGVFENKSTQASVGVSFANELVKEIIEKTDTQVVSADRATRRIVGIVTAITFSTLSRSSTETVVERRVTARMDVRILGPDNQVLWSVKDFSANEDYTVASDKVDDQENIRQAVEKIAVRSAERLVSSMMLNF